MEDFTTRITKHPEFENHYYFEYFRIEEREVDEKVKDEDGKFIIKDGKYVVVKVLKDVEVHLTPKILSRVDNEADVDNEAALVIQRELDPNLGCPNLSPEEYAYFGEKRECYAKRRAEYPKIEDQLDMLYHEIASKNTISNEGEWFLKIKKIKDESPKPEEV